MDPLDHVGDDDHPTPFQEQVALFFASFIAGAVDACPFGHKAPRQR